MFYTFKETQLSNFFTYKDTIVPLHKQGLVIVKGYFEDQNGANGAGKSLLFSSVPMLLQGQLPTGKIKVSDSKSINITSKVNVNDDYYSISLKDGRYKIRKNKKSITPYRKPDALKYLQDIFPSDSLLNSTSFVSQFSPIYTTLIAGTPALRMKVIESFIDQTKLTALKERVKDKYRKLSSARESSLEVKTFITTYKEQLKKLPRVNVTSKDKADLHKYKKQLLQTQEDISELLLESKEYQKYKKAKDKIKTKKSSSDIKREIKKIENNLPRLSLTVERIKECHAELKIYSKVGKDFYSFPTPSIKVTAIDPTNVIPEKEAVQIIEDFERCLTDMDTIEDAIEDLTNLKGTKNCPTCHQTIKKSTLDLTIKTLDSKFKKLQQLYDSIIDNIKEIIAWCKVRDKIKNTGITKQDIKLYTENGLRILENKLSTLDKNYILLKNQLPYALILETFDVKKPPEKDIDELRSKAERLEEKISALSEKILYAKTIREQKEKLEQGLKTYQQKKNMTSKFQKDEKYIPIILKTLTSRDFRTEMIYDFCESLVNEWNLYASDMFNQKTKFSLGTEHGYPAFLFSYNNSKPYDIRFLSGGEKKRLIMCMVPSILSLSPSPTNILVIDELDANVDDIGTEAMLNFLPNIIQSDLGKDSIFFITPRSNVSHSEYQTWFVNRVGDISNLNIRG